MCSSDLCSSSNYLALSECTIFQNLSSIGFLFPAIIFALSAVIAFSTGTSWGTFAILLPLVPQFIGNSTDPLFFVSIAAVLGGSVCGDHLSPISDTTILSSSGARCNFMNHVKSQIPYALIVCSCTFVSYLILGIMTTFMDNQSYTFFAIISLVMGIGLLLLTVFIISKINDKPKSQELESVVENLAETQTENTNLNNTEE